MNKSSIQADSNPQNILNAILESSVLKRKILGVVRYLNWSNKEFKPVDVLNWYQCVIEDEEWPQVGLNPGPFSKTNALLTELKG